MTINSILYSQALLPREPILLSVGDKTNNYESLASYLAQDEELTTTSSNDTVELALDKVAGKMLTEIASLTADTILDYPEFADNYVLTIIDDGAGNREVRVYTRNEILDSLEGTDEEKAQMKEALDKEPLVVVSSAENLPPSSTTEAAVELQEKVEKFLTTNEKLLDLLDTYGYNPFEKLKQ
ncbi:MAG: hypothetical protein LBE38_12340 [Deltaproteobacteria bacterium]|jgi:hypothetical protein|nr:hypothetical protein [Deltaproteobacteria bacterium]